MYIKKDINFYDLQENCWSGALDTLKTIEAHNKEDDLMAHLEEIFETSFDNVPTMTEVNDYLWFGDETIFEALGISETEDEEDVSNYDCFDDFCCGRDCKSCPLYFINGDCEENFNNMKNA